MAGMKIILKQDVANLGKAGTVVEVARGYGRNYLIPKGLALPATPQNEKQLLYLQKVRSDKLLREKSEAEAFAAELAEVTCTITRKTGEKDRLYGSVTTMDIEENLKNQGILLDRKKIRLESPIKSLGTFEVPVRLHPEVTGKIKVRVVKE